MLYPFIHGIKNATIRLTAPISYSILIMCYQLLTAIGTASINDNPLEVLARLIFD
jgi:hypothetical protein